MDKQRQLIIAVIAVPILVTCSLLLLVLNRGGDSIEASNEQATPLSSPSTVKAQNQTRESTDLGAPTSLRASEDMQEQPLESENTRPAVSPKRKETGTGNIDALDFELKLVSGTGQNYWIAPSGSGVSTEKQKPGSFQDTLSKVCDGSSNQIKGGDVVTFTDGSYGNFTFKSLNCGIGESYITLRSENPHKAKISDSGFYFRCSSYFIVEGFEFSGKNSSENPYEVGINILDYDNPDKIKCGTVPHHIVIRDNLLHNLSSAGLNTQYATHVVFENNTIHSTSLYDAYQTSAISFYGHSNPDGHEPLPGARGYSNIIRNNRVYNTKNIINHPSSGKITDGNCIIIDVMNEVTEYTPRTLVANNTCTNNARGINILTSSNVDVFNNIFYQNQNHVASWSELSIFCDTRGSSVKNVTFKGNVVVPTAGSPSVQHEVFGNDCPSSALSAIEYSGNIFVDDLASSNLNPSEFPNIHFPTSTDLSAIKACEQNVLGVSLSDLGFKKAALDGSADFSFSSDSVLNGRNCEY